MPKDKTSNGKKKRRARGTGTIFYKPEKKRWVGRKPIGKKADGSTEYLEVWGDTQGEVVRRLSLVSKTGPDVTVKAWSVKFMAGVQVRASTQTRYRTLVDKWIAPLLGSRKVRDVTPTMIEEFARRCGEKLKPNTVRKALGLAGSMFKAAIREGIIASNPVVNSRRPKGSRVKINPFSSRELKQILARAGETPTYYPIVLMGATGCRIGEALACDVTSYEVKTGKLTISQTFDRHGLRPTKTERGLRTIKVPASARGVLMASIGVRTSGPLFVSSNGARREQVGVLEGWMRLLGYLDLPYRNPHQLRHTVATILIAEGVPIADVAAYLGDAVETIVKTYLHPSGVDPSEAMESLLSGRKVGGEKNLGENPQNSRAI